jgi:signal transduction histidine kinase
MKVAPAHPQEADRLSELHALQVLDTPPEPGFDALTALAREISGFDVAVVSLVDADRQWFKSCAGPLDATGTGRDISFCAWTILAPTPLVVPDARIDPRFEANPLVVGPPFIRAYCGIPLVMASGLPIGTLCLLHPAPREPSPVVLRQLVTLGGVIADLLRQRARSRAVEVMSHEIRTTLQGVIGLSGLLAGQACLPPQAARQARLLGDAGDHLVRLTNDALDFARIEAGRIELDRAPFDPAAEFAATMELLAPQARARPVTLRSEIAPGLPALVRGDPGRLRQVLLNLVGNAMKFAPGGEVLARLEPGPGPRLSFTIRDNGIGMTEEERGRLFTRFGQAGPGTARRFGGSGLGLFISRRLVELMGGRIQVESDPGRGSTFSFDIAAEPVPAPAGNSARQACRPRRVLLVEDSPVARMVTRQGLGALGHLVQTAPDGEAAVAAVAAGPFDVVLMDLELPGIDGLEATRAIRRLPEAARGLRILGLTGATSETVRADCAEAGMDGVLWKPIRLRELAAALG